MAHCYDMKRRRTFSGFSEFSFALFNYIRYRKERKNMSHYL